MNMGINLHNKTFSSRRHGGSSAYRADVPSAAKRVNPYRARFNRAWKKLVCSPARRLHRDERGSISVMAVFTLMFLAMLLGMVMNVGRQADGKIRMQNAADAAAYSGGVVLARGMNSLAMTNHLMCDVFAVTAFLREARDRNSEKFVPQILNAWSSVAPVFNSTGFSKFQQLGDAIAKKVPLEQQLVTAYSEWVAALSRSVLPMMERILAEELIPKYQRAVVLTFPEIAQSAALEIARRNGNLKLGRGEMLGALWRWNGTLVGAQEELMNPSLPVVDPTLEPASMYFRNARNQRRARARQYLDAWNNETLAGFDREAKMCQFANLWRSFTCGYLNKLLDEEYANSNLPFQIIPHPEEAKFFLQQHFMYVGVVYWKKQPEILPGLFRNPMANDSIAFAQSCVFLPAGRLQWQWVRPVPPGATLIGGVPGELPPLPGETIPGAPADGDPGHWVIGRQGTPVDWSLMTQHWTCQLVPVDTQNLSAILQTIPPLPAFDGAGIVPPNLGGLGTFEIEQVNTH
jgi:hypothetical protein